MGGNDPLAAACTNPISHYCHSQLIALQRVPEPGIAQPCRCSTALCPCSLQHSPELEPGLNRGHEPCPWHRQNLPTPRTLAEQLR